MRYEAPESVEAAVKLLAAEKGLAKLLSGGTDLLVQMRSGTVEPDLIVDLKHLPGARKIADEKGGFRIGTAVSAAEMDEHAKLKKAWPGVVEAAMLIGSTQVKGRATVIGNLCNASPAADSVPALIAGRAIARVAGPKGQRDVPVEDIATGPGKTSLRKGEFVASVFLPKRAAKSGDAYLRFIPRTEMDIAVVGCGVSLTFDAKGTCTDARVCLGAVGPKAIVVEAGAKALIGTKVDDAALDKLAEACSAAAQPIDDKRGTKAFRIKVAGVLGRRATAIAKDRALGKGSAGGKH